ncbi:MAG TPA: flagellar basal-body rod protein FlgG [Ramlibacter sp.]|nr:flagellar basal-body rod protein FlgG [Ramlibacter sp.]
MFDALYIGATGMQAQQTSLETIANNVANVNTAGFKRAKVGFTDLMAHEVARAAQPMVDPLQSGILGSTARLGAGVGISSVSRVFESGELKGTNAPMDVAIRGDGFIEVALPDGTPAFTRGGTLKINRDGLLAHASGHPIKPGLSIPENAESVAIAADGRVQVRLPGQANPIDVGQIELVRFAGAGALAAMGDNLFRASEGSGEPILARAGEDGAGLFAQGFLESSNVKMVDEMVSLMLAQRGYEASVKVVQAADEMLGLVNNLRK